LRSLVVLSLERDRMGEQVRALAGRIEQLETWDREVRSLLPAARELKAMSRPSRSLRDASSLKRSAKRALDDFRSDPQTVRRPDLVAVNVFWREAPRQLAALEAGVGTEWRDYVNGGMPEYRPDVVRVLAGANAAGAQSQITALARRAQVAAARLPRDDAEAVAVRDLHHEATKVMQQFELAGLLPEVHAFIQAALADDATLDHLTPAVHAWLRERGIEDSIRISFAPQR
jgi:hypothetical protein